MPTVAGAQGAVVEGIREEIVYQGTKGHAVAPAGREVLDVNMLRSEAKGVAEEKVEGDKTRHTGQSEGVSEAKRKHLCLKTSWCCL